MKKQKECLVTEAMDKCQCEMCKINRKFRDFAVECEVKRQARAIFYEAMKEAKII